MLQPVAVAAVMVAVVVVVADQQLPHRVSARA